MPPAIFLCYYCHGYYCRSLAHIVGLMTKKWNRRWVVCLHHLRRENCSHAALAYPCSRIHGKILWKIFAFKHCYCFKVTKIKAWPSEPHCSIPLGRLGTKKHTALPALPGGQLRRGERGGRTSSCQSHWVWYHWLGERCEVRHQPADNTQIPTPPIHMEHSIWTALLITKLRQPLVLWEQLDWRQAL